MAPLLVIFALVIAWLYSRGKSQDSQGTVNYQGSDNSAQDYSELDGSAVYQYNVPGVGPVSSNFPLGPNFLSYLQMGIELPLAGPRPGESPYGS